MTASAFELCAARQRAGERADVACAASLVHAGRDGGSSHERRAVRSPRPGGPRAARRSTRPLDRARAPPGQRLVRRDPGGAPRRRETGRSFFGSRTIVSLLRPRLNRIEATSPKSSGSILVARAPSRWREAQGGRGMSDAAQKSRASAASRRRACGEVVQGAAIASWATLRCLLDLERGADSAELGPSPDDGFVTPAELTRCSSPR